MNVPVSELIVKFMERLGIEVIFGMPGAHILPVYDGLYDSSIKPVLAKHEQGASFMAGGYARAAGRISACITTAGPGATNLVTGIANAYADKQPILIITGETSTHIFGKGGLQESSGEGGSIDQSALFQGITRYNKIIERTDYLGNVLNQAAKVLLSDTSGPVLLSFPYNVQKELVDDAILDNIKFERQRHPLHQESHQVQHLADLIDKAQRPVIIAGYGCILAGAREQVATLSNALNIPVTTSLKGKGIVNEDSPLSLGSLGVTSGGYAYKYIIEHSDLIIFLGASFNERTSYLWDGKLLENGKIVQIDSNPDQLEKVFKADLAIGTDIAEVLNGLIDTVNNRNMAPKILPDMPGTQRLEEKGATAGKPGSIFGSDVSIVEHLFSHLEQHFQKDLMVFDDNIIFAQNFYNVSSQNHYYPNSGISSLGHAIPAAIGARFAHQRPTIAIIGDGGFQMCCMEIMTAVNYQIPFTIILFNNQTMGLIRKGQFQQYEQRYLNCDFLNPDYAALAQSFGIEHRKIENDADLDDMFAKLDFSNDINLVEVMIDKDAFPNYSSRR